MPFPYLKALTKDRYYDMFPQEPFQKEAL